MRGLTLFFLPALISAAIVVTTSGATAGGGFDPSFGDGGKAVLALGSSEYLQSAEIQADGKIVVAGAIGDAGSRGLVARFGTDGRLDGSFGNGGRVVVAAAAYRGAVAVQADQKIVFAGMRFSGAAPGASQFHLERLNADGSPDTSFGTNGAVDSAIGDVAPYRVLVDRSGRSIVVGQLFSPATQSDIVLARFTSDGHLDTSFGSGGRVVADWGAFDVPFGAALAPDGSIVVGGFREGSSAEGTSVVVERFTADGRLDPGFGANGGVATGREAGFNAGGVAVQPDGKVVVAAGAKFTVMRLTAQGRPDGSFGTAGIAELGGDQPGLARDVAIQANGKIVVFGYVFGPDRDLFLMKRVLPNGKLDPSFVATTPDIAGSAFPEVARVDPRGRPVGVGWTFRTSDAQTLVDNGTVLRYLAGTCVVPSLVGVRQAAAEKKLAAADCRLGRVKTAPSKRGKGMIVAQKPAAGRVLADWALVDVTVSSGKK